MAGCAVLALALGGCVTDDPPVRACAPPGVSARRAPNKGELSVLPSEVPGLSIDSARWFSESGTIDFGVNTRLVFAAVLHSTTPVPLDSVAMVYRGRRLGTPLLIGDATGAVIFSGPHLPEDSEPPRSLAGGSSRAIENDLTSFTDMSTSTAWIRDCPATVQAIWRRDIILALGLDEVAERRLAAQQDTTNSSEPTRIVVDTLVQLVQSYSSDYVAAAVVVNVTDRPATDVNMAFLGQTRIKTDSGFSAPVDTEAPVPLGTLKPHERRTVRGPRFDALAYSSRYVGAVVSSGARPLPSAPSRTPQPWYELPTRDPSKRHP